MHNTVLQATTRLNARQFAVSLEEILGRVCKAYSKVCMIGDFNIPEINWSLCETSNYFVKVINSYGMTQLNTVPSNKHGNYLDLGVL